MPGFALLPKTKAESGLDHATPSRSRDLNVKARNGRLVQRQEGGRDGSPACLRTQRTVTTRLTPERGTLALK